MTELECLAYIDAFTGKEPQHPSCENYVRAVKAYRLSIRVLERATYRPTGVNMRNGEFTGWDVDRKTVHPRYYALVARAHQLLADVSGNI